MVTFTAACVQVGLLSWVSQSSVTYSLHGTSSLLRLKLATLLLEAEMEGKQVENGNQKQFHSKMTPFVTLMNHLAFTVYGNDTFMFSIDDTQMLINYISILPHTL